MMNKILILILIFAPLRAFAGMESEYEAGSATAQGLQNKVEASISNALLNQIPHFKGANPPQAGLTNNNLADAATAQLQKDEVAAALLESSKNRQRFKIDPKTDPMFKFDPTQAEQSLSIGVSDESNPAGAMIEKICEEGGQEINYECFVNRYVEPRVPIKTETLTVKHLKFVGRTKSESYVVRPGNFWRHTQYGTRNVADGFSLTLPKEISAFRAAFCPRFTAIDAKTGIRVNLNCQRIQGFEIVGARSATEANGIWNIVVAEKTVTLILKHDTYEGEGIDEWRGCEEYEKMVEEGLCQYGARALSIGPQTRNINGQQVYKEEWQYKQSYDCKMIKDECSPLRAQGCVQVGSDCKEVRGGRCWIYAQKYHCPNAQRGVGRIKSPSSGAFCLTGDCHNASFDANQDMLEVISRLNVLKEIQDNRRANGANLPIFKGSDQRCSRNCINFKDCCRRMKGWGVSLHLAGCNSEEKQLAMQREKHLCHIVGTYCAQKAFGKCVTKKTSFCCFGSKMARLLQEQGRTQLHIPWGEAETPNCRGLTIEELSKLDLSKINFSEMFSDIMQKYKAPDVAQLTKRTIGKVQENLDHVNSGLKSAAAGSKTGVLDENKEAL